MAVSEVRSRQSVERGVPTDRLREIMQDHGFRADIVDEYIASFGNELRILNFEDPK